MNFFNLADFSPWMQTFLGLFCMFGFAFLSQPISKRLIVRSFDHWRDPYSLIDFLTIELRLKIKIKHEVNKNMKKLKKK